MTDTRKPGFINAKRRGFLQGAAVAGGVAASGTALGAETPLPENTDSSTGARAHKGYEKTEHVARYYDRARF